MNITNTQLPIVSRPLVRWFTSYSRGYIKRHFHALRVNLTCDLSELEGRPLVIYSNHASWWDPLVGLVLLREYFPQRTVYAPIDAGMLMRYRMFSRMGFFGVEKDSRKGAEDFLAASSSILNNPNALLAVTAQGRFADVRDRPANIKRGLGHLSMRNPTACFLPACIEYVFWEEKRPEILVKFGKPITFEQSDLSVLARTLQLEQALESTQDDLASLSQLRSASAFTLRMAGRSGQGGVYELWRKLFALTRGETYRKEVGSL